MTMNAPDKKTLTRMQKLLALARQGVGGEADNAERFLARMLAKHGMTLEDIEGDAQKRERITLKYKTELQAKLLTQILAKVMPPSEFTIWERKGLRALLVDLTPAEHAEVVMHQAALTPALTRHMATAFSAFVQTNRLFMDEPDDDCERPPMDPVEAHRLAQMMAGCERVDIHKALAGR